MRNDEGALPERGTGSKVIIECINNNYYHVGDISEVIVKPKHITEFCDTHRVQTSLTDYSEGFLTHLVDS